MTVNALLPGGQPVDAVPALGAGVAVVSDDVAAGVVVVLDEVPVLVEAGAGGGGGGGGAGVGVDAVPAGVSPAGAGADVVADGVGAAAVVLSALFVTAASAIATP